jgi:uncharacterized protein YndB with AHSA1/START domain
MHFEHTLLIRRPPPAVFDFLMQPTNNLAWQRTLLASAALTDEPVGPGWRFRERRRLLAGTFETEFEVEQHDPPRFCQIRAVTGPARLVASYRLEPCGDATTLTASGRIPICELGQVVLRAMAGMARRELAIDLEGLREILEATPPVPVAFADRGGASRMPSVGVTA